MGQSLTLGGLLIVEKEIFNTLTEIADYIKK